MKLFLTILSEEKSEKKICLWVVKKMNLEKKKGTHVLNKNAAPIQITAEQLILKTKERQQKEFIPPSLKIIDAVELEEFRFPIFFHIYNLNLFETNG
jgi:hypothetical protein